MPSRPKPAAKPATNAGPAGTTQADATPTPPAEEEDLAATLARATGSAHASFSTTLLNSVAATLGLPPDHPLREQRSAAAFGAMVGIEPQNPVEGMLGAHLAVLNSGALALLQTAAASGNSDQASRLRRDAMAAMRVFNETLNTLQNLRGRTTRQVLTIERLDLGAGAQAIIGAAVDTNRHG